MSHEKFKYKKGILLLNLGTPQAPTVRAIRRYLKEFLSDPKVVKLPRLLWLPLLYGYVLPFRSRRNVSKYLSIWTQQGSPLQIITERQAEKLNQKILSFGVNDVLVLPGMRYGIPSIGDALSRFRQENIQELAIIPLFPQYAESTIGTIFAKASDTIKKWTYVPKINFVSGYADNPKYIQALADSIQQSWQSMGRGEVILFSYHGLPKSSLKNGDPYYCFCHKTSRLLAEWLGLKDNEWSMVFQSRFGAAKWLEPTCVDSLTMLAKQNIKNVDVVCPGFSADCLETLEEINIVNKDIFIKAGGEQLNYIPALNDSDAHIEIILSLL